MKTVWIPGLGRHAERSSGPESQKGCKLETPGSLETGGVTGWHYCPPTCTARGPPSPPQRRQETCSLQKVGQRLSGKTGGSLLRKWGAGESLHMASRAPRPLPGALTAHAPRAGRGVTTRRDAHPQAPPQTHIYVLRFLPVLKYNRRTATGTHRVCQAGWIFTNSTHQHPRSPSSPAGCTPFPRQPLCWRLVTQVPLPVSTVRQVASRVCTACAEQHVCEDCLWECVYRSLLSLQHSIRCGIYGFIHPTVDGHWGNFQFQLLLIRITCLISFQCLPLQKE